MNRIYVLGTGNGDATKCYNTCFTICNGKEHFLVDAGGGNGILAILKKLDIKIETIHNIFISHKHVDHLLGLFWLIRQIGGLIENGKYEDNLNIYCHEELAKTIKIASELMIVKKFIDYYDNRIHIIPVKNREKVNINNYELEFVDIASNKDLQYGFIAKLDDGKKVAFLGDEPYKNNFDDLIQNSDYLLSEAFCLYDEREKYKPYEKHHSTVKDSCETAERLNIKNLVLWHTEEDNLQNRRKLYTNEAKQYFKKNIIVPDDLEIIEL